MKPGDEYIPHKKFMGIFIPIGLVQSGLLSPGALVLFGRLSFFNGKNQGAWPTVQTLATELHVSVDKVTRWMHELITNKLVKRSKRGAGKGAECVFIWHPILESSLAINKTLPKPSHTAPMRDHGHSTQARDTAPMGDQTPSDTANMRTDTAKIRDHDTANLRCAYKEEKIQSEKNHLKDSSSSSSGSSELPADDDDEFSFSESQSQSQNQNPEAVAVLVRHSTEDIEALSGFLQDFLNNATNMLERDVDVVPPPSRELVDRVIDQARGWTAAQIAYSLQQNAIESRSKPKVYNWFVKVVADIFARRKGIPPDIPVESPYERGPYRTWVDPYEGRDNSTPKPELKCAECRDTGRIQEHCLDGRVAISACPDCDLGRKLKAERDALQVYESQSDRWQVIYRQHQIRGAGSDLDFSKTGMAFHVGTADVRDRILSQLEAGLPYDKVELPGVAAA